VSRIRRDVVVIVVSLAVFAVCAVVAADGRVGPVERALFHAVNGLPSWLYRPMLLFQYLGVLAMPLVVAAGALATLNAVARVYLGAHNLLDVVGGAAVGLAIAAALDLVLDVARDHSGRRPGRTAPTGVDRAT
jgi:hypothetical protein